MKIYPEEWECAQLFQDTQVIPRFCESQLQEIRESGKRSVQWCQTHPYLHNTLNLFVIAAVMLADLAALLLLPAHLLGDAPTVGTWVTAMLVVSGLHGFITYSMIVFSMHEGAAHDRIILCTGPLTRGLAFLANNLCRVFYADPIYYRRTHIDHHRNFGTPGDLSFTNFVWPRRFFVSLLPTAGWMNFNDYRIHADTVPSRSRFASFLVGTAFLLGIGFLSARQVGVLFPIFVLVLVAPWIAFTLDRLRETTDHNLMALDTENGARNLGLGFWGMLIGGGPWGQPCHLSHHLMPALPWYQQCLLHRQLRRMMSPEQKRYFLIAPIIGFPRLIIHLISVNVRYAKKWVASHPDKEQASKA